MADGHAAEPADGPAADRRGPAAGFAPRQLEAFRSTLANGSLTRAAAALGLSQPAVTKLIAALEAEVGFALFVRSRTGVTPTAEGVAFGAAVERHFVGLGRLGHAAREIRDLEQGHTRMAVLPALATDLLPGAMARFSARFPTVRVNLEVHTAARVVELVETSVFDVGITHLPAPSKYVSVLGSYEMDCVVVMPPDHPLTRKRVVDPADLDGVRMLTLAQHTLTAQHISQMLLRHNLHPVVQVDCQPSFLACALACRGLGVAIVDPLTPRMVGPDRVAVRPLAVSIPFQFKLIIPAVATPSRATWALVRAVADHIAETPEIRVLASASLDAHPEIGAPAPKSPD